MTTPEASDQVHRTHPMRKTWISVLFVVLAGLAAQGATTAYWVNRTLLETDRFMAVVTPIIASPEFAEQTGSVVASKTVDALGVEEKVNNSLDQLNQYLQALPDALGIDPAGPIGQRLPDLPDLTNLTDPIVTRVEGRVSALTEDLVSSDEFQNLADTSIRDAHAIAVAVITEDESGLPTLVSLDGDVEINFRPMIADAIVEVVAAGAEALGVDTPNIDSGASSEDILSDVFAQRGIEVPEDFGRFVVISEDQLAPYRSLLKTLNQLQWVLILLTLLFSFAAIWTNPDRLVGTIWLGVGIVVFQLLNWPLTATINNSVIDGLQSSETSLVNLVLQTATSELLDLTIVVIAAGVVITIFGMVRVGMEDHEASGTGDDAGALASAG